MKISKYIVLSLLLIISCGESNYIGSSRRTEIFILPLRDSLSIYNPWKWKKYTIENDTFKIEYKLRNYKGDLSYKEINIKENIIYTGNFIRNEVVYKKYPLLDENGETKWVDEKVIYPLKNGEWIIYQYDTIYSIEYWKDGELISKEFE